MANNSRANCKPDSEGGEKVKFASVLLECPFCLEIPAKDIYQCCNGHSLCDTCYEGIEICPLCAVSLKDKVRNRAMEALIAGMDVQTAEIKGDQKRDGESDGQMDGNDGSNICKSLGLTNCKFSSRRAVNIYYHLKHYHQMPDCVVSRFMWCPNMSGLDMSLKDIRTATDNSIIFAGVQVIINGSPEQFVIVFYTNITKTKDFSVICLHLGKDDVSTQELAVRMEVSITNKNSRWSWSGKPTHYVKIANAMTSPSFKVSIASLLEEEFGDDELLDVNIKWQII